MRWLIEVFFRLAAALPARAVPKLGRGLGFFLHRIIRFRRRRIEEHLGFAFPRLSGAAKKSLLARIYSHFGILAIELLRLPRQSREEMHRITDFTGIENLESALARQRGVLVLAGHLGNWELALAAAAARGYKIAAVTKEIKSELGQYIANRIREPHRVLAINRRNAIRPILSALKSGGCVGFVLDQNMTAPEGVFVDFFGRPACTMPGLAVLAKRYQIPVVPVFSHRDEEGRHHIRILPEVTWDQPPENLDRDFEIRHNTQRYTHLLEQAIRAHPDQWLWMHGRWRTRPEGSQPGARSGSGGNGKSGLSEAHAEPEPADRA